MMRAFEGGAPEPSGGASAEPGSAGPSGGKELSVPPGEDHTSED